jgi:hypothetical protein
VCACVCVCVCVCVWAWAWVCCVYVCVCVVGVLEVCVPVCSVVGQTAPRHPGAQTGLAGGRRATSTAPAAASAATHARTMATVSHVYLT